MGAPIKVLVVDDSALIRRLMTELLSQDGDIEVVGVAQDPLIAREKIKRLNPDVLTLDVEMPRMDGLTFLSNLMRLRPMPVVMVSSLTERGADVTLRALELGAVDFVAKPKVDVAHVFAELAEEVTAKVKAAASARVHALASRRMASPTAAKRSPLLAGRYSTTDKVIAIGASTGGTEAIREVLGQLPADAPGIVIAQHIPEVFSRSFAERLDRETALVVREATDGQQVLPGHAFVAPGNAHLQLWRDGARYRLRLSDAPPVNRHRPSVDVLFESVAEAAGKNAVGVILTGMGADGAKGLVTMKARGAHTIAQNEASCVVFGMPREAIRLGGAEQVLPLDDVAEQMLAAAAKA